MEIYLILWKIKKNNTIEIEEFSKLILFYSKKYITNVHFEKYFQNNWKWIPGYSVRGDGWWFIIVSIIEMNKVKI